MKHAMFFVVIAYALPAITAHAEEKTATEFKEYVDSKLGGRLDDHQLDRVTKLVDKDGNGVISEEEFSGRMAAIRSVLSGGRAPRNKPKARPEKTETKKVAPVAIEPFLKSGDATVLLITADELARAWVPFAKWKTEQGKLTKVVTMSQIRRHYEAKSVPEKIRLCVREHIDRHRTRWVILGGDCLPGGRGLVPGGHRTVHTMEPRGIPTDIVYLSATNWDADEDGIYGEFEDDRSAITYPDGSVGLGRIPVRTNDDVRAFTEKVVAYESAYPDDNFAKSIVYTCTDRPAYPKVRNSWDGYLGRVWDGQVQRFFSAETPWDKLDKPGSFDLSAKHVVDLFNKKQVGKIHIHGHGHLPGWVLEKSMFTGKHASQLSNQDAYPLITTVSCNTGEYDSDDDPSIVEQMLRLPKAGSVAIVAPVRTGKAHFAKPSDFRLMVSQGKLDGTTLTMARYWSIGLGQNQSTGHSLMKAKQEMASDAVKSAAYHLCVCELNLLGDPTLDMRRKAPQRPKLQVRRERNRLVATTDAPESTVCFWFGQSYEVVNADGHGVAVLDLNAALRRIKGTVTVSGPSLNVVQVSVEL